MHRKRAILILTILSGLLLSGFAVYAQDAKPSDVDVTVTHQQSGWVVSPVWMAIGGIALVALIALIVASSRGTGSATTVVKE